MANSVSGMVRPSVLAVLLLITSSNLRRIHPLLAHHVGFATWPESAAGQNIDSCFPGVDEALSTLCGGQGVVIFFGMAKPVRTPQIDPAREP
jgi:hypothetical protein